MYDVYVDFETTGLNCYMHEIIEGYFSVHDNGKEITNYHLKSQVDVWNHDAEIIHQIPYVRTLTYPDKRTAFRDFLVWLADFKDFMFMLSLVRQNKKTNIFGDNV